MGTLDACVDDPDRHSGTALLLAVGPSWRRVKHTHIPLEVTQRVGPSSLCASSGRSLGKAGIQPFNIALETQSRPCPPYGAVLRRSRQRRIARSCGETRSSGCHGRYSNCSVLPDDRPTCPFDRCPRSSQRSVPRIQHYVTVPLAFLLVALSLRGNPLNRQKHHANQECRQCSHDPLQLASPYRPNANRDNNKIPAATTRSSGRQRPGN